MVLAHILQRHKVPTIVLESRDPEEIYRTGRAGLFDHTTYQIVKQYDLSKRIDSEHWSKEPGGKHRSCLFTNNGRAVEWSSPEVIERDLGGMDGYFFNSCYPQIELVWDMHEKANEDGLEIWWHATVDEISGWEPRSPEPSVKLRGRSADGAAFELLADFVVGCGGYQDPVRKAMMASGLGKERAVDWGPSTMGIFADAVPSTNQVIYGYHADGMAAHVIRTNTRSRYYIELPLGEEDEALWPDERVWKTLAERLARPGWTLNTGKITSKQIFRTQHLVVETMGLGRACVAGDAAHSRPYLGARGANAAIHDAYTLAELLVQAYDGGDGSKASLAEEYSRRRLPCIYETARFTHDFYRMCFANASTDMDRFYQGMGNTALDWIQESMEAKHPDEVNMLARWFAYCYCQPCVLPEDAGLEWLKITPAGNGVNRLRNRQSSSSEASKPPTQTPRSCL